MNSLVVLKKWTDLLAVYKPQGWLTIPGRKHRAESPPVLKVVLEAELLRLQMPKPLVVHRLDEGTSGIVLFALSAQAHKKICMMFESGEIKKTYIALCDKIKGDSNFILGQEFLIHDPILKLPSKKNKSVVSPKGKASQTIVKILKVLDNGILVQATPLTGRSHQIRVHLANKGLPLIGDKLYNPGLRQNPDPSYPLLFAQRLEFFWESQDSPEIVECPLEPWAAAALGELLTRKPDF